ncbi:MAG: anthranilate synthase component I family protein, partial [Planctomycetota bacterium]|nr:anthranilate synthase component I family protein [Planctomycetota bacterium]
DQPVLSDVAFEERVDFGPLPPPRVCDVIPATGLAPMPTRVAYEDQVARVIEHIRAGDIFQANLTQPFTGRFGGDPRRLFRRLCAISPAPFAAFYDAGDGLAVLSASPEEFLQLDGRDVRTRPIKGTRPRDPEPGRDAALRAALRASSKDLAELAMIVDLLRNDLGKVAEIGSVRVGPFPEEASFAQVHHLFATVSARLRAGVTIGDLLRATFPGGSITGAPKLRCMEILEQLEWVRRGVYTGSIGWLGPGPRLHLNVAIRTMVVREGVVRFHVGGGVTADSDPAAEYEETLHKAAGMLAALGVSASESW